MKRRRRRRFQSQVTVDEGALMSNVEQEADNSKRNSEESDVVLKNQQMVRVQQMKKTAGALSMDDVISIDITISRKLLLTSRWLQWNGFSRSAKSKIQQMIFEVGDCKTMSLE
ncbi:hypothetical protein F511_45273 [Dorcoceras hygrometricum]|uniref:Uncharacterized protein n=1 Tax=Dorcoceras hygrometricum TaxID=472368 RepID=A0A2Z7A3M7_9LAMI|nr:hypothetical protein F511_45273 [Dorcoceras hygrometricum]